MSSSVIVTFHSPESKHDLNETIIGTANTDGSDVLNEYDAAVLAGSSAARGSIPTKPSVPSTQLSGDFVSAVNPRRVLFVLFLSNCITLIFTVIPVLVSSPASIRDNYYNSNDILRLLEPLISLPLQIILLMESVRVISPHSSASFLLFSSKNILIFICFGLSAALYQQGAGFHSAANMFKHPIEKVQSQVLTDSTISNDLNDIYSWMETTWEHYISHYMYAAGGAGLAAVFAYQYRNIHLNTGLSDTLDRIIWLSASIIYGIIVGSVAIEFPFGPLVALIYVVCYGFLIVGTFLYRSSDAISWGKRFVLQYYIIAYTIALAIIVIWIGIQKGIESRNSP